MPDEEKKETGGFNEAEKVFLSVIDLLNKYATTFRLLIAFGYSKASFMEQWLDSGRILSPVSFFTINAALAILGARSLLLLGDPEGYSESIAGNFSHLTTVQFVIFFVISYYLILLVAKLCYGERGLIVRSRNLELLSFYIVGFQCFCIAFFCVLVYLSARMWGAQEMSRLVVPLNSLLSIFMYSIPFLLMYCYVHGQTRERVQMSRGLVFKITAYIITVGNCIMISAMVSGILTGEGGKRSVSFVRGSYVMQNPPNPVQVLIALRNDQEIPVLIPKGLMTIKFVDTTSEGKAEFRSQVAVSNVVCASDGGSFVILPPTTTSWLHFQFCAPINWFICRTNISASEGGKFGKGDAREFILRCKIIDEYDDKAQPMFTNLTLSLVPIAEKIQR